MTYPWLCGYQVLLLLALPGGSACSGAMLANESRSIGLALSLVPYSGIAFLWFIGVMRDLLGEHEDRFFMTMTNSFARNLPYRSKQRRTTA